MNVKSLYSRTYHQRRSARIRPAGAPSDWERAADTPCTPAVDGRSVVATLGCWDWAAVYAAAEDHNDGCRCLRWNLS